MYEGEVTELTPEETENQLGGYGKVISHVIIGLKTVKGTKQLKLDPTIYDSLQKEQVQAGAPGTDPQWRPAPLKLMSALLQLRACASCMSQI